jgi:pimeloyl-ACP methyl ester carboxylesterase
MANPSAPNNNRKTFVLVHGGMCGGWIWHRVSGLLQKAGHRVFSPTMTGLGERSHLLSTEIGLETHITDLVNVIDWEDLDKICLVAHSYAGFPCSGVLERIGHRVASIVWIDAYMPQDGEKMMDLTSEELRRTLQSSFQKGDPGFSMPSGAALFPASVNEVDSPYLAAKLTPQPVGTYMEPIRLSGAREKVAKKTYIRATKFPNPELDRTLRECKATGALDLVISRH